MKNNSSGKVLVIFLVVIAILLISLTAISMFFFQKEIEKRKVAESSLQDSISNGVRLEMEVKDYQKKNSLFEEKNKEMDERVNGLLDELELEQGLRAEMKNEITSLKTDLEEERIKHEKVKVELDRYQDARRKIDELEGRLEAELRSRETLETRNKELEENFTVGENSVGWLDAKKAVEQAEEKIEEKKSEVKLEPIVVNQREIPAGRILSIDKDTDFVIVDLGEKDGLEVGKILSVYRGNEFLGDIQVTRVQPEMSAADLIPPFSAQRVRKNDQVVSQAK